MLFPDGWITHLTAISWDHRPLLLETYLTTGAVDSGQVIAEAGNTRSKIKEISRQIEELQIRPLTMKNSEEEGSLQLELDELLKREEIIWRDKAKAKWLEEGDSLTDHWTPTTPFFVSDLMEPKAPRWEKQRILQIFLQQLAHEIFKINIPHDVEQDTPIWTPSKTWRPRNELLHGHQIGDWTTFVDVVSKTADKYWKATMDRKMKSKKDYHAVSWKMPSQGTIKINFDAAFTEDLAIVALIARDHTSSVLGASTGSFAASDPFKAETLAANEAFKCASKNSIQNPMFEGDALNVLRAV
ncbi:hypothetical protein M9H77_31356 [Catharanthus roseus]|uniref:Uncharacterized protein n=1 Tax=Catharanthus roseus TaxID=4058 RepID=A0ACC0A0P1_CATRO|nr:hypothetical protein M9H77_31356 [Catharanthus roseus]